MGIYSFILNNLSLLTDHYGIFIQSELVPRICLDIILNIFGLMVMRELKWERGERRDLSFHVEEYHFKSCGPTYYHTSLWRRCCSISTVWSATSVQYWGQISRRTTFLCSFISHRIILPHNLSVCWGIVYRYHRHIDRSII